jgi:hypothetical protein
MGKLEEVLTCQGAEQTGLLSVKWLKTKRVSEVETPWILVRKRAIPTDDRRWSE